MPGILDLLAGIVGPQQQAPNQLAAVGNIAPSRLDGPGMFSDPGVQAALAGMRQNAPQLPTQTQQAPQAVQGQQMPQRAPAPQSGGNGGPLGGIGDFLGDLLMPQRSAKNRTVQWLQQQGMDEGTATLLAGNKNALQSYLLQRTQGADPKDALQMEKLALEIEQMRNPTTDDIREYQFAVKQGYAGTLPEFMQEMRKAGATSIDNRQMGTVPPGYRADYDEAGNVISLTPIPGGPAAQEQEAQRAAQEQKEREAQTASNIVTDDIDRALSIIDNATLPTTGAFGEMLSGIGGTEARDLRALLDTVKAKAGFRELQAMRDSSPTGGALGQVTERDLALLQATIGNLEQSQSKEQLKRNLMRVREVYNQIIHGPGGRPMSESDARDKRGGGGLGAPSIGTVEDGYRFKGGDPGDPNSWERVQ